MTKITLMSLICLMLISLGGCAAYEEAYHRFVWYQPGKTIEQARRACDECIYEVGKTPYPSDTLLEQCMTLRGYRLYTPAFLNSNGIPIQEVPGVNRLTGVGNPLGLYNDVAGP